MKIRIKKGKQFLEDRLITIETKGEEAFNLSRWFLLTNQLAFNESNKYERALQRGLPLYFEEATKRVISLGRQGVDLMDDKNENILKKFCKNWKLNFDFVKQTKLNDFEKNETS